MLLLLVRFAFQDVIHTGLAAGDVQVFIVSEQLLAQRKLAGITRPGGVAYLVVCRDGVEHGAAQRVGDCGQVIRFVVKPFPLQAFISLMRPGLVVPGILLRWHPCARVSQRLVKSGPAASGGFHAAQVMLKCQRGMVRYLPGGQTALLGCR